MNLWSKRQRRRQSRRTPWQMILERLESRSLLSATITAPATQTTLEGTTKVVSGLLFTSSIDPVTVTLSVTDGTLTLDSAVVGGVTGAQISGNGTSQVSITANVANVNTTLANATGLTYTPSADFSGSDSLAININNLTDTANASATLTVTSVNDTPSFTKGGDQTVLEDAGAQTVAAWATSISAGPNESSQTVDFQVTNDHNEFFSVQPVISATGTLTYTPAANRFGVATVTVFIHDNGGVTNGGVDTSASQTFTITLTGVNDAPSFTKGPDQTVLEDAGAQSVANWATNISAGTLDAGQTVDFQVTNNNNSLFSVQPAISSTGTLTFTPAANQNGTATVTVLIHDNGGTANGGVEVSATQTFTITVGAVNDEPSFTVGGNQTVLEDASAQTVANFATAISAGTGDSGQTVDFQLTNDHNEFFSVQPAISATGTLTYTPAANRFGVATVTVFLHDNGGTAGGGDDTSPTQTFTITITAVNDVPSFTKGPDQTVLEDAAAQTIPNWATNISAGTLETIGAVAPAQAVDFQVTNNNNSLFSVQPAISPSGELTYTLAANQNGSATVTVLIHDNDGTANGGVEASATQTFTITVTSVNDAPTFTMGPNQKLLATTAAQTFASFATNISAGPFESTQTVDFIVNNDRPGLFTVQPAIAANGTLTYTPSGAVGVAVVSVRIHDNGGTTNGGVDTNPTITPSVPALTFTITISASATGTVVSDPNPVYKTPAGAKLRAAVVDGFLVVQVNGVTQRSYEPGVINTLTILGGSKNDEIDLTGLDPVAYAALTTVKINGGAGNDRIVGSFANDSIDGGAGNDTLSGGDGDDTLIGNSGTDLLIETAAADLTLDDTSLAGLGTDTLVTIEKASFTADDVGRAIDASAFTRGAVTLIGGAGNDTLLGGSKNDAISGRDGDDELAGGAGNDTVLGGFGFDTLDGDGGNDLLIGGFDDDLLDGGAGRDTVAGGNGGTSRGGDGIVDAGDAIMNAEVISEAFKKLFAFE